MSRKIIQGVLFATLLGACSLRAVETKLLKAVKDGDMIAVRAELKKLADEAARRFTKIKKLTEIVDSTRFPLISWGKVNKEYMGFISLYGEKEIIPGEAGERELAIRKDVFKHYKKPPKEMTKEEKNYRKAKAKEWQNYMEPRVKNTYKIEKALTKSVNMLK